MMLKKVGRFLCCLLIVACLQQIVLSPATADEQEDRAKRVQLLKEKMKKLQALLEKVKEEKLREQPPKEFPWQPILKSGDEWPAYAQYAYLLAPHMQKEDLDSILQQLHYLTSQDPRKERGTLFIIPALPLESGEQMTVEKYNRDMASQFLKLIKMPTALEGGLIVSPDPLGEPDIAEGVLLYIDLTGCNQILRSRIFEALQTTRLFIDDGSVHAYLWELLKSASPQSFKVYRQDNLIWLSVDNS
jgi:hypothetical protein